MERFKDEVRGLVQTISKARNARGELAVTRRGEVVRSVERFHAAGHSYQAIATALGLNFQTLMSWRRADAEAGGRRLEAVRVQEEDVGREEAGATPRKLIVLGPNGLRLEGVSVEEVALLFRRLS